MTSPWPLWASSFKLIVEDVAVTVVSFQLQVDCLQDLFTRFKLIVYTAYYVIQQNISQDYFSCTMSLNKSKLAFNIGLTWHMQVHGSLGCSRTYHGYVVTHSSYVDNLRLDDGAALSWLGLCGVGGGRRGYNQHNRVRSWSSQQGLVTLYVVLVHA